MATDCYTRQRLDMDSEQQNREIRTNLDLLFEIDRGYVTADVENMVTFV